MQRTDKQQPPFDAVLKRGLDALRSSGGVDCPDAATLAAYCERVLPASQNSRWEEHFSNCARCQGALAAIARAQTAQHAAPSRTFVRRWELYAALAAAVAGISIVAGLMRNVGHQVMPAQILARNELVAPAQVSNESAPKAEQTGPLIALNEPAPQANPVAEAPAGQQPAAGAAGAFRSRLTAQRPSVAYEEKLQRAKRRGPEPSRYGSPGEFRAEAPPSSGAASQQRLSAAPRTMDQGVPAAAPPPPPPAVAMERAVLPSSARGAPVAAPAPGTLSPGPPVRMAYAGRALGMVPIRTADGIERWRLGAHGRIVHLASDGQWLRQDSGVSTDLSAGAAPSPSVCWAVGAGGTILRTTDGEHWQRLDSPTSANLAAVSAIDAASAVVTTADGRRFATSDGGRTWRPM